MALILVSTGMAKHFENASRSQSFVGTMSYMAPEVVEGGYDGCKVRSGMHLLVYYTNIISRWTFGRWE